jgi:hypothetical protein
MWDFATVRPVDAETVRVTGDDRAAQALAALPSDEWTLFRAPNLPHGGCPGVDHVLVGPSGVFVVDSARWTATVHVRRDVLRRKGRLRERALSGALAAATAVGDLLEENRRHLVRPVVCFSRDERIMGWGRKVMICSTGSIVSMLLVQPAQLSASERETLCADLALEFRAASVVPGTRPPRRGGLRALRADPASPAARLARLLG